MHVELQFFRPNGCFGPFHIFLKTASPLEQTSASSLPKTNILWVILNRTLLHSSLEQEVYSRLIPGDYYSTK